MQMSFNTLILPKNELIEQNLLSLDIFEISPFCFQSNKVHDIPLNIHLPIFLSYWVTIATAFLGYLS